MTTILRTKVVGHRGLPTSAPENTIDALRAAAAAGMTWTETDVQLTADGVPVIVHDSTVDRTTNGTGAVNMFTLAQLRTLDAGCKFVAGGGKVGSGMDAGSEARRA